MQNLKIFSKHHWKRSGIWTLIKYLNDPWTCSICTCSSKHTLKGTCDSCVTVVWQLHALFYSGETTPYSGHDFVTLVIWKLHVGNITFQLIYFWYFTISCLNVWRIPNQFDRVIGALNHVTLDLTIYLCSPILCLNKVSLLDEFWWCDDIRL